MRELGDSIHRRLSEGRFQVSLVWEGALVGLVGGLIVVLYRMALSWGESTLRLVISYFAESPWLIAVWFAALAAMMLAVGALVRWEPDTSGSGIPQVDAEVMGELDMRWQRVVTAKFAEGTLGVLAGLSLGREGPSVQLGAMAGKGVSRLLRRGRGEERLLVTCGAGAGMAAAFHAPLAGVMFTIEEIHKTFTAPLIISVMSSAIMADYLASQILGLTPVVSFTLSEYFPHASYILLVPFGVAMGVFGAAHNLGMYGIQELFGRIKTRLPWARLAVPFALAGVCAVFAPTLLCGGDELLELLKHPHELNVLTLVVLVLGKYAFTAICFGSGAPGGTLFPLVVMGAMAGAILGKLFCATLGVSSVLIVNFMVLGIVGMFSGAVRAPVTAVVLAFELTGSMRALLSLSIVSIFAYVTANLLKVDAYYEHLLGRLLGVSPERASRRWGGSGRQLHSYVIEPDSALAGHRVSEVAWPAHTLVVTVTRYGKDLVPRGETRLHANDTLLVLFQASTSEHAESTIRELCHGGLEQA